jgi:hypothetical protein
VRLGNRIRRLQNQGERREKKSDRDFGKGEDETGGNVRDM